MAFCHYRDTGKSSESRKFDIERFVYDFFAYALPLCGFPEEKIPTSCREDNEYVESDFIVNVVLEVLPIAFYMRDEWKCLFESKHKQNGFRHILDIEAFLESVLQYCDEIEEDDTPSKVQYSLALYNEIFQFLNYKGIEVYFDILPKSCIQLCRKLFAQSEQLRREFEALFDMDPDITEEFEALFDMDPDITEEQITFFIRNYAASYGSRTDVSDLFSHYAFLWDSEDSACPEETSIDKMPNFIPDAISQSSNVSNAKLEPYVTPQDSESRMRIWSFRQESRDSSKQLKDKEQEEKADLETRLYGRHSKGLAYILHRRFKGTKRSRSAKLEIEDAFKDISFGKENVSPENRNTKRRRHSSDRDKL